MAGRERSTLQAATVVVAVGVVACAAFAGLAVPSPVLLALLGPLAISATIAAAGWLGPVAVPTWVQGVAFAVIGVQVGLRFDRASLAAIGRMLPVVVLVVFALIAATAGLGALLAWLTPVDALTAYLATTPGGLFAGLAIAAGAGAHATYVMAVQLLLARWLRRSG